MPYTEQQISELKAEFAKRRKRQLLATIPFLALFVLIIILQERPDISPSGPPAGAILGTTFVIVLGIVGFSLWNWRCPACKRYLGKGISPAFCSKCGVALR